MKKALLSPYLFVVICYAVVSSCASKQIRLEKKQARAYQKDLKAINYHAPFFNHVIQVNRRGHPINPFTKDFFADRGFIFKKVSYVQNNDVYKLAHLGRIMGAIKAKYKLNEAANKDTVKLMLYAHGGLASKKGSRTEAYMKYRKILETDPSVFPVFINWSSGLFSSYLQYATVVQNGYYAKPTLLRSANFPLNLSLDLANAVIYVPRLLRKNLFSKSEAFWANNSIKNANSILADSNATCCQIRKCCIHTFTKDTVFHKGIRRFNEVYNFFGSFISIPLGSAVATLGKPAWQNMSRRTKVMFRNSEQFSYDAIVPLIRQDTATMKGKKAIAKTLDEYKNVDHSGPTALLVEAIIDLAKKYPDRVFQLSLYGHSMGSMVMNELLKHYGDKLPANIYVDKIVYMAAACKISDWEVSVAHFLKHNKQTDFFNITLHPKREKQEKMGIPILNWLAPPGSLLEWVDKLYEDPHSFTDRTLGCYDNFVMSYSIIENSLRSRIHLKTFPYAETKHKEKHIPIRHGEVDDYSFWMPHYLY